jgi:hypothetical protein
MNPLLLLVIASLSPVCPDDEMTTGCVVSETEFLEFLERNPHCKAHFLDMSVTSPTLQRQFYGDSEYFRTIWEAHKQLEADTPTTVPAQAISVSRDAYGNYREHSPWVRRLTIALANTFLLQRVIDPSLLPDSRRLSYESASGGRLHLMIMEEGVVGGQQFHYTITCPSKYVFRWRFIPDLPTMPEISDE